MASSSQTQSDIVGDSVSAPQTTTNISIRPSQIVATHNNVDRHVPRPFVPSHVSPFQARDAHRNQQSLSSASNNPFDMNHALNQNLLFPNSFPQLDYHFPDIPSPAFDMTMGFGAPNNIPFDINHALDQNLLFPDSLPQLDYHFSDFPGSAFDMTMGFGGPNNIVNSYHAGNVFPQFQSDSNSNSSTFSSASGSGVQNFHTTPVPQETQSNWQQLQHHAVRRPNSDFFSGGYGNQVRVHAPPIHNVDGFDGRFLSLGIRSNSVVNTNSAAYRGIPSHPCQIPFPPRGQLGNYSHDGMGRRFSGFQSNVHNLEAPSGSLTLAQTDCDGSRATTSGFGVPPVPIVPTGQVNMQHIMSSPRRNVSEFQKTTNSRASSSDPSGRRIRSVPFNSSVLRSNHQQAADQLQRSHVQSDKVLTLPEEISGGILKQDRSDEGAAVTVENQHPPHSATAVAREPPKRNLESSQQAMMQYQRRRITSQTSSRPFSPHLMQNAPGHISSGQPMWTPVPAYAPPRLMHPPIAVSPDALARTVSRRARTPAVASSRVMRHSPSTVAPPARQMSPAVPGMRITSHGRSAQTNPTPSNAALQPRVTIPYIKWQGSDAPPTVGFKCMLCKRDLSFTPEGPVSIPRNPPQTAVLPCGHTFHDHCLQLITPDDQSDNPPCISCAMGE
ncbi:hypothetical protein RND81_06G194800 [Saponaria officinalis]|uniref:RING-type domain-containing protein n=1 Tax=Saponaria officinalis TaxID=3572 RepID=A0AAW1K8P9_SAPOF